MTTTATPLDTALAGWDAGLSMVLIREDGSKRPGGRRSSKWKRRQQRRCSRRALEYIYRRYRRTGVGFVTGRVSGHVRLFEFDCRATFDTFLQAAEYLGLGGLVTRVRSGYEEDTPGGGIHWLVRADVDGRNTELAKRPKRPEEQKDPKDTVKVLIETREEGGFAVVAPSNGRVHPSGKPYRLVSGSFTTIATITPEEWRSLCDLARSFDQMPVKEYQPPAAKRVAASRDDGRPGVDFAARTDWPAILEPAGYTFIRSRGDGVSEWTRPGKTRGLSATTNHAGSDLLYVFTSSTDLEANRGYGKFTAYALLHHGGDFKAAARELTRQGYGTRSAPAEPPPPLEPIDLTPVPDAAGCPELAEENARLRAQLAEERRLRMEERDLRIAAETELAAYKAAIDNKKFTPAERVIAIKYIEDLAAAQRRHGGGFAPNANVVVAEKVGIKAGNLSKHLTVITASLPDQIERVKVGPRRKESYQGKLNGSKVEALREFARADRIEPTGERETWGGKRPAICPDHPTAAIVTKTHTTHHCGRCDRQLDPDVSLPAAPAPAGDTQVGHAPVSTGPRLIPHTQVGHPTPLDRWRKKQLREGLKECVLCHQVGKYDLCPAHESPPLDADEGPPADPQLWEPEPPPERVPVVDDDAIGECASGCGRQVPLALRRVCLECQAMGRAS